MGRFSGAPRGKLICAFGVLCLLSLVLLAGKSHAYFRLGHPPLDVFSVGQDQEEGVVATLSLDRESKSPETLRKLGANRRLDAKKHLLSLSSDPAILADPLRRLALVEALHRHNHGSLRLEVTRALIRLFEEETVEPSRFRSGEETDDLVTRVRGTTAMALALGEHPLGLRVLLAKATHGSDLDPLGAALANNAMLIVPEHKWQSSALSHLFDPGVVESFLEQREGSALVANPAALVALAGGPPSNRKSERLDITAWSEALFELAALESLPRAFGVSSAWADAYAKAPTFTLRSLACLAGQISRPVRRLAERLATRSLGSADENQRSAAAWALAVVAPERSIRLLDSRDPVVVAAVLGQAHTGALARAAANLLTERRTKSSLSKEQRTAISRTTGWEPSLWDRYSSTRLWSDESADLNFRFAILASRFDARGSGQGPSFPVIRTWLDDSDSMLRSAAALGLGRSRASSSAGLLLHAYRREANVEVRRALVSALSVHPNIDRKRLAEWVQLDPDSECRHSAVQPPPAETTFRVKVDEGGSLTSLTDSKGRVLWAIPAPDGFVGIVSTFE